MGRFDFDSRRVGIGGWGYWRDNVHTDLAKQTIAADTRTLFTVDGLHSNTNTSYTYGFPASTWSSNTIWPDRVGNSYVVRVDFKVAQTAGSGGHFVNMELDIGSVILPVTRPLSKGNGVTQGISDTWLIFALDTFNLNGGKIYIESDVPLEVWDKAITIQQGYVA